MIGLGLAAVLVIGGGLYLFMQVTSDPATPAVAARDDRPAKDSETASNDRGSSEPPRFTPRPRTGSGSIERPVRPASDPGTSGSSGGTAPALAGDDDGVDPDVDLDAAMDEANKFYDGNDYEAATKQALRVLAKHPENVRMMRIVVASGCYMGDVDQANKYMAMLPARDQGDMLRKCTAANVHLDPVKPAPSPAPAAGIRKP
jgi:hypothetical protein